MTSTETSYLLIPVTILARAHQGAWIMMNSCRSALEQPEFSYLMCLNSHSSSEVWRTCGQAGWNQGSPPLLQVASDALNMKPSDHIRGGEQRTRRYEGAGSRVRTKVRHREHQSVPDQAQEGKSVFNVSSIWRKPATSCADRLRRWMCDQRSSRRGAETRTSQVTFI